MQCNDVGAFLWQCDFSDVPGLEERERRTYTPNVKYRANSANLVGNAGAQWDSLIGWQTGFRRWRVLRGGECFVLWSLQSCRSPRTTSVRVSPSDLGHAFTCVLAIWDAEDVTRFFPLLDGHSGVDKSETDESETLQECKCARQRFQFSTQQWTDILTLPSHQVLGSASC